jgi:hypothetical protein
VPPPRRASSRRRTPVAAIASWPIEVEDGAMTGLAIDPWTAIVRRAIEDMRLGRLERAAETWHDDATWTVRCVPEHERALPAPGAVIDHLRTLGARTANTFRQHLLGLTGSNGPVVTAYVRTLARRGRRTLDQPSLLVFEVAAGRIRRVTELPGDVTAWCRFWDE